MGQQQLLLLVLATIIVGIATVVGIQAFSQNNIKSNADALMNDAVRIASDAQAWAQKSAPFGGPAAANFGDVTKATLPVLGYADPAVNTNGSCELDGTTTASVLTITCENTTLGNEVAVDVNGLTESNVTGKITILGGVTQ
jgi:hypothetical protein